MKITSIVLLVILSIWAPSGRGSIFAAEIDYIKSVCITCHGADGIAKSELTPNLAGQREKYLAKQLRDFRKSANRSTPQKEELTDIGGKRRHPIMSTIATRLSDGQIEEIAHYYSSQTCRTKINMDQAKSIPKVTSCLACHDENETTHEPWVPRLSGQNKLYLINQIYALRVSAEHKYAQGRSLRSHPVMEDKIKNLSALEIETIANYFASRRCK
ncbi:MAG: cytochrome c4 [Rhodospirillaceae bacterium]|jgi:cytochrome c553|nr:cytochrome c4 [Rhodospirillaceae bacterium]